MSVSQSSYPKKSNRNSIAPNIRRYLKMLFEEYKLERDRARDTLDILKRESGCACCGTILGNLCIDHIISRYHGILKLNEFSNLKLLSTSGQVLCLTCNKSKGTGAIC